MSDPRDAIRERHPRWWRLLQVGRQRDLRRSDNVDLAFVRRMLPWLLRVRDHYYRGQVRGLEHLPEGAFLLVGMHGGGPMTIFADNLVLFSSFYAHVSARRPLYGMIHNMVPFLGPVAAQLARFGAVEGDCDAAERILRAGHGFVVYPGGELDMARPFWRRDRVDFRDHVGFVRVALRVGAPILPMGSVGGHATEIVLAPGRRLARWLRLPERVGLQSWPIALGLPWGLMPGYMPYLPWPAHITMAIGAAIAVDRSPAAAAHEGYVREIAHEVERAAQRLTDTLAEERRQARKR